MTKQIMLVVALFAVTTTAFAQIDAQTIIQRSVEANDQDWATAANYDYFERDQQPSGEIDTYQESMIFGSPYKRLIAVNGQPLSPAQQAEEAEKLRETTVERREESPPARAGRIAAYQAQRKRDQLMMAQLTEALNFVLIGQQKLNGYDVYVLKATPKPGYQPPNTASEVLKQMQGELWIDTKTFQWVKVQAQVIHPVTIGGFVAEVEPGTRFELEKMPVAKDLWLPKHFSMNSQAKVFFLFPHNDQADKTYFNYHTRS